MAELLCVQLTSHLSVAFSVVVTSQSTRENPMFAPGTFQGLFRAATGSRTEGRQPREANPQSSGGSSPLFWLSLIFFLLLPQKSSALAELLEPVTTKSVLVALVRWWVPEKLDHLCCTWAAAQWLKKPTNPPTNPQSYLVLVWCQLARSGHFVQPLNLELVSLSK